MQKRCGYGRNLPRIVGDSSLPYRYLTLQGDYVVRASPWVANRTKDALISLFLAEERHLLPFPAM